MQDEEFQTGVLECIRNTNSTSQDGNIQQKAGKKEKNGRQSQIN